MMLSREAWMETWSRALSKNLLSIFTMQTRKDNLKYIIADQGQLQIEPSLHRETSLF
jgi:hypothetical protein